MVSAVFHSPSDASDALRADKACAKPPLTPMTAVSAPTATACAQPARAPFDWAGWALKLLSPVAGLALLVGIWALLTMKSTTFPTPLQTWDAAVVLFSDPFYSNGPNDQGIGWNIWFSLKRVAMGFGLAALVGIPMGFIIGRSQVIGGMLNPIISLLRPVSPLAWLPIGLLVFKSADPAAIWTIFICSIWPMIINTAVGVQRVPEDYLNVAKVLNLSEWKIVTKILFPSVLPYMLTGVRLSVGTAWLVIVAAEMLTGGVGIGFWVWDEWNNLNVQHIIIAIFVIGIVGLLLENALVAIAKRFSFE
ncbi:nitrate ABC transporter permease [Aquabacterium parvum]|jgi:nitrate/nitrite transport system permease protein|uniref:nitrate ABC transporter permease n=1 Tax=Aquabacterium parvum TaxID=70584 RepID=UPI000718F178|nr:nitrate ABC transporter permease [Aquabacterium parvum]MBU0915618.1 nitrate ABC transporter permease [Gammaproteobacteria bacterium]